VRKVLNENPVVQIALLGGLAVIVAFLLLTRATSPTGSATAIPSGKLVAGPGLPKAVANAYADDKAVVVLITRRRGIDDDAVKASVELLRANGSLAVFVANAGKISRFSRITEGVNVNRASALVVVRPKHLTDGPPTATVS
jgi:hypothetical protein